VKTKTDPKVWTYLGVALLVAGCVLLAVAWGLVAGKTQVSIQIPYLLSAGFPGVGLVMVGIGLVILGARESDARARRQQQEELINLLTVLREELNAEPAAEPVDEVIAETVAATVADGITPPSRARRTRKAAQ
jgi:hypothetical protein